MTRRQQHQQQQHNDGGGSSQLLCCSRLVADTAPAVPPSSPTTNQDHEQRLSLDSRTFMAPGEAAGAGGVHHLRSIRRDAPEMNHGLLVTLHRETGHCQLSFCPDAHFEEIHPNAYAPAALTKMRKLGGGGSGVAVFEGHHPTLGNVVMKHGGDKDLKELFALATIAQELQIRGNQPQPQQPQPHTNNTDTATATTTTSSSQAARELQARIPEFRMIYISPNHLGEKRRELWHRLFHLYRKSSRNLLLNLADDDGLQHSASHLDSDAHHHADRPLEPVGEDQEMSDATTPLPSHSSDDDGGDIQLKSRSDRRRQHHLRPPSSPSPNGFASLNISQSGTMSGHREIAIYAAKTTTTKNGDDSRRCCVELLGDQLAVTIPQDTTTTTANDEEDEKNNNDDETTTTAAVGIEPIDIPGDGYQNLKAIVEDLVRLMKDHKWKLTLGQKRIGGDHPLTGNQWLYAGKLHGKLLENLVTQKIRLVRDLATLTTPDEKDPAVLERVRKELARYEEEDDVSPSDISAETDSFVGNAIKKNFQEEKGRFAVLTTLGQQFRNYSRLNLPHLCCMKRGNSLSSWSSGGGGSANDLHGGSGRSNNSTESSAEEEDALVLVPDEEIPAHHLGSLTRAGSLMGDTFENVPPEPTVLEGNRFMWQNLLRAAVQPRRQQLMKRTSPMALTRIWTCGLTDAGVHNLFLAEDSVWLFDLGQPQLYSAPGFLTKFLFSFFHTLGMEESPGDSDSWIRRFEHNPDTNKLRPTPETEKLLAHAYDAFEITFDRLIDELFDRDDSLRWLLIQYVTLQLVSDASFCLQRWAVKGGGQARDANHHTGIEKWLWRALWDLYIAFDINTRETWTRLYVEHPSHRESVYFSDMNDLVFDNEAMATLEAINEKASNDEEQEVAT